MNLKRSHSAMSSNNNREEVDEVQFRDDQGEVVIEGRGRGSGREGSSVTAADEEEHRYATLHQQQYQQAAPPSSLHRHSHPRMQQQYQPPTMMQHEQQQQPFQYHQPISHSQWYSDPNPLLEHHHSVAQSSVMRNPQTPQYPPPHASSESSSFSGLKSSSTEFMRQQHQHHLMQYMGTPATRMEGVGGFGIVGQTPPTGGSYGSFASGPTPQQHQQIGADAYTTYAPPHGSVIHRPVVAGSEAGGMRVGGLHGNTRLLPTPVVRRGGEYHQPIQLQQQQQPQDRMQPAPSPGTQYYASQMQSEAKRGSSQRKQHQQSQQSLQQKKLDPLVEGVEEDEDPAMLRYESRPGMDASPMVATSKDPHHHVGVGVGVGVDARMQEVEKAASEEATRAPSRPGGAGSSGKSGRRTLCKSIIAIYISLLTHLCLTVSSYLQTMIPGRTNHHHLQLLVATHIEQLSPVYHRISNRRPEY